jgi:uncharacterized OB-fold protein
MMNERRHGGWIDGEAAIAFQRCQSCEHVWYFRREFCPNCGAPDQQMCQASGTGRVCALSLVHRAPSEALRALTPYLIVMIDMDEGFRIMAHGDPSVAIGDRVRARFVDFGGKVVPHFEKESC